MWTNADEVKGFLDEHPRGVRFNVGDRFVLPDIEQAYVVHAVRPFKTKRGVEVYLEFASTCAVEDCGCEFLFTKSLSEMCKSPYVMRTCPEHRRAWKTPMEDAWKTSEERKAAEAARESKEQEALERSGLRMGSNERLVIDALEDLLLVDDAPTVSALLAHAVGKMPYLVGKRDTRRQQVSRALANLGAKGVLVVSRMRVTKSCDRMSCATPLSRAG
jgi:hypothetical protein